MWYSYVRFAFMQVALAGLLTCVDGAAAHAAAHAAVPSTPGVDAGSTGQLSQHFQQAAARYQAAGQILPSKRLRGDFVAMVQALAQLGLDDPAAPPPRRAAAEALLASLGGPPLHDQVAWAARQTARTYRYDAEARRWQLTGRYRTASVVPERLVRATVLRLTGLLPFGAAQTPNAPPPCPGLRFVPRGAEALFGVHDGPQASDVSQANLGDSLLLAALGEVAQVAPGLLRDSLTRLPDRDDGRVVYRVRLHAADPLRRGALTAMEMDTEALLPTLGDDAPPSTALWVALYEKAFAAYDQAYKLDALDPHQVDQPALLGLGQASHADVLPAITGRPSTYLGCETLSLAELRRVVERAGRVSLPAGDLAWESPVDLRAVRPGSTAVLASSMPSLEAVNGYDAAVDAVRVGTFIVRRDDHGDLAIENNLGHRVKTIVAGHPYMVLGLAEDWVVLQNPWGQNDPLDEGDGYLPAELFAVLFEGLTVN